MHRTGPVLLALVWKRHLDTIPLLQLEAAAQSHSCETQIGDNGRSLVGTDADFQSDIGSYPEFLSPFGKAQLREVWVGGFEPLYLVTQHNGAVLRQGLSTLARRVLASRPSHLTEEKTLITETNNEALQLEQDIVRRNREFTLFSWSVQQACQPLAITKAKGTCFWTADGKRYLDYSSQLMNVNIGHGHPKVIEAIKKQADELAFVYPGAATRARGEAAEKLVEVTPANLKKVFFTLGGADGIENAMKMARLVTGREKVMTRYRSYHGSTFGAMSAGGDPRRLANEPGVPWIVRMLDPYSYRSPLYRHCTPEEGDQALVDLIEEQIEMEGPENIAAILLEGYSGSSGIIAPASKKYWLGLRGLCDKYGIKLIIDEVMSGFGRTGEWFGIDNYGIEPDLLVCAKGLTCGYVPLGAVVVSGEIAEHFDKNPLWCGLTYSSHPISCAAASACIDVYREEGLIERARTQGDKIASHLDRMVAEHPSVGEHRGIGLFRVLELVKNRQTKEPMSGFNKPPTEPMQKVAAYLKNHGFHTFVRWDWVFVVPPLCISDEEIEEGMSILDGALSLADPYSEG